MSQTQECTTVSETKPLPTERIPADLMETEAGWELYLALPGVPEADVEVQVENGTLAVRATRKQHVREGARIVRGGPGSALLERDFVLPEGIGPDAVQAELVAGILRVSLARPAQERTTIPIRRA